MAHHEIRAAHVDGHHLVPKIRVPLQEAARRQRRIDRGVIDQDIDLPEALDGLRHQVLDRLLVADVAFHARHAVGAMTAGDFGHQILAVGDIGYHHAGAFGGQRLRVMPADTLGPAGDDGDFSFKPRH